MKEIESFKYHNSCDWETLTVLLIWNLMFNKEELGERKAYQALLRMDNRQRQLKDQNRGTDWTLFLRHNHLKLKGDVAVAVGFYEPEQAFKAAFGTRESLTEPQN